MERTLSCDGRKNHGSVLVGDQIMIIGGVQGSDGLGAAAEVEIWNLHSKYQHLYFYRTGSFFYTTESPSAIAQSGPVWPRMGPLFPVNIDFCRN